MEQAETYLRALPIPASLLERITGLEVTWDGGEIRQNYWPGWGPGGAATRDRHRLSRVSERSRGTVPASARERDRAQRGEGHCCRG
ncbi:hypothetical protein [Leucobacter sp. wl10]|uniref:hypothetical protein n=1 Tax=Leucobacter sp. wl10 TaxID=2304677 RepID=UPI00352B6C49